MIAILKPIRDWQTRPKLILVCVIGVLATLWCVFGICEYGSSPDGRNAAASATDAADRDDQEASVHDNAGGAVSRIEEVPGEPSDQQSQASEGLEIPDVLSVIELEKDWKQAEKELAVAIDSSSAMAVDLHRDAAALENSLGIASRELDFSDPLVIFGTVVVLALVSVCLLQLIASGMRLARSVIFRPPGRILLGQTRLTIADKLGMRTAWDTMLLLNPGSSSVRSLLELSSEGVRDCFGVEDSERRRKLKSWEQEALSKLDKQLKNGQPNQYSEERLEEIHQTYSATCELLSTRNSGELSSYLSLLCERAEQLSEIRLRKSRVDLRTNKSIGRSLLARAVLTAEMRTTHLARNIRRDNPPDDDPRTWVERLETIRELTTQHDVPQWSAFHSPKACDWRRLQGELSLLISDFRSEQPTTRGDNPRQFLRAQAFLAVLKQMKTNVRIVRWLQGLRRVLHPDWWRFEAAERVSALASSSEWPRQSLEHLVTQEADSTNLSIEEELRTCEHEIAQLGTSTKCKDLIRLKARRWFSISKSAYRLGRLCRDRGNSRAEKMVRRLHRCAQSRIWLDALGSGTSKLIAGSIFLALFAGLVGLLEAAGGNLSSVALKILPQAGQGAHGWYSAIAWFVLLSWCGAQAAHHILRASVRWAAEKTRTELDDILTMAFSGPAVAAIVAVGLILALGALPDYVHVGARLAWRTVTSDGYPIALFAILTTWIAVLIFNRVLMHIMERWARATEQQYDDMFARLFRVFGTFVIVALAGALLLLKYQAQIGDATGIDNILLPYSIVVSVLTAVLGYSVKEGVEVFFGSFLLQVDKPFEVGERLVLESGEVCDVRSVGVRTTRLHNVLENAEISLPNRQLISQKITNISRPDLELRIQIVAHVPNDAELLEKAEGILLDTAYFEPEVDQSCLLDGEVPQQARDLGRKSVREQIEDLRRVHESLHTVFVQPILGRGVAGEPEPALPKIEKLLSDTEKLREEYGGVTDLEDRILETALRSVAKKDASDSELADAMPAWRSLLRSLLIRSAANSCMPDEITRLARRPILEIDDSRRDDWLICSICQLPAAIKEPPPEKRKDCEGINTIENVTPTLVVPVSDAELDAAAQAEAEVKSAGQLNEAHVNTLISVIRRWFKESDHLRYAILLSISDRIAKIEELVYTIGDVLRDIRNTRGMEALVSELGKEPLVRSTFHVTDEGKPYAEISLAVYSTHLERKYDVTHQLHKEIQRRFVLENIQATLIGPAD